MSVRNTKPRHVTPRYATILLLAVSVYAVLAAVVLQVDSNAPTLVRIPLAAPLLVFAPGYALVCALFPLGKTATGDTSIKSQSIGDPSGEGFSLLERCSIATVVSVAVVPMVVLAVNTIAGIDIGLVVGGVTMLTVGATGVAFFRKSDAGPNADDPLSPAMDTETGGFRTSILGALTDTMTLVAVGLTGLLLLSTVAISVPGDTSASLRTEFYVANDTAGDSAVTPQAGSGTARVFDLRVAQHSDSAQRYTVVVVRDQSSSSDGAGTILGEVSTTVPAKGTGSVTYGLDDAATRDNATVRLLLYRGDSPSNLNTRPPHRVLEVAVGGATTTFE